MDQLNVTRTVHIRATRAAVWDAITQPELLSEWFGDDADLVAEPGAAGSLTWNEYGVFHLVVEAVDPQNSIAIRWAREKDVDVTPTNSTVFRFVLEDREHGIDLTVIETGWESLEGDIEKHMQGNTDGWREELDELVAFLEKQDSV